MTDTQNQNPKTGGKTKVGVAALYFDIAQHVTPPLAGYLSMNFPTLGLDLSYEIVVAGEAALGAFMVKLTPMYFRESVTDGIIWIKTTWKEWTEAAKSQ